MNLQYLHENFIGTDELEIYDTIKWISLFLILMSIVFIFLGYRGYQLADI